MDTGAVAAAFLGGGPGRSGAAGIVLEAPRGVKGWLSEGRLPKIDPRLNIATTQQLSFAYAESKQDNQKLPSK